MPPPHTLLFPCACFCMGGSHAAGSGHILLGAWGGLWGALPPLHVGRRVLPTLPPRGGDSATLSNSGGFQPLPGSAPCLAALAPKSSFFSHQNLLAMRGDLVPAHPSAPPWLPLAQSWGAALPAPICTQEAQSRETEA